MIIAECGRTKSSKGKKFTEKSIKQHQRDCEHCIVLKGHESQGLYSNANIKIIPSRYYSNYFDEEIPDGAYWALRQENPFI